MTMKVRIKNEGPEIYRLKGTLIDRPARIASPSGGSYPEQPVHSETFELAMGEEKEIYVHSTRDLLIEEKTQ